MVFVSAKNLIAILSWAQSFKQIFSLEASNGMDRPRTRVKPVAYGHGRSVWGGGVWLSPETPPVHFAWSRMTSCPPLNCGTGAETEPPVVGDAR